MQIHKLTHIGSQLKRIAPSATATSDAMQFDHINSEKQFAGQWFAAKIPTAEKRIVAWVKFEWQSIHTVSGKYFEIGEFEISIFGRQ